MDATLGMPMQTIYIVRVRLVYHTQLLLLCTFFLSEITDIRGAYKSYKICKLYTMIVSTISLLVLLYFKE